MPEVRIPAGAFYIASLDEPKRSPWRRLVDRLPWRRNRDPFAGWQELGYLADDGVTFAEAVVAREASFAEAVQSATLTFQIDSISPGLLDLFTGRSNHVHYASRERYAMRSELRLFHREARRIYDHAIYELEAASVYESEIEALAKARFALRFLGPEAAVAILRGWMRNPRRIP